MLKLTRFQISYSSLVIVVVQVGAMKIYVTVMEALGKKER
jgi:hypothetical protein